MKYAGYPDIPAAQLLGYISSFCFGLGLVIAFDLILFGFRPLYALAAGVSIFVLIQGGVYIFLATTADRRAQEVEEVLPDALQLMAANIRAGMTTDRAIWLSARPEFGPLETEIKRVSSKVMGGERMDEALGKMKERINSDLLDRAVKLMIEGIRSGGEMATLLDETASDIRTAQGMKDKVKSNVTMYSMFIVFASVLGAPLLFAVSLYFIEVTSKMWGEQMMGASEGMSEIGVGMISMSGPQIAPSELRLFALAAITMTTIFGGLIIGLIQEGKATRGLKYCPPMVLGALGIFLAAKTVITKLFGGFLGF